MKYLFHAFIVLFWVGVGLSHAQDTSATAADTTLQQHEQFQPSSDSANTSKEEQLQQFREAFKKLVNEQNEKESKIEQKEKVKEDPPLDLGVMVFNETRTRMGRDFYNLFYQKWKTPVGASNASITVMEEPSPGLGSIVSVKVGYEKVFKARLQPRYQYIEQVSKQAVARCQKVIKQQTKVRKQLTGY